MNKEFIYSDLFKLLPQSSKASKLELAPDGKTPAYSSDTRNNGCVGFVNKEPLFKITEEAPVYLVFGDHTRTMNIVRKDFCAMDNVKVLAPLFMMSDEVLLYITTCWKKAIPNLGYARHWSVAKTARFELPVIESSDTDHEYTVEDIDFEYMKQCIAKLEKERIAELERERIAELDAYLAASCLDNYELTDEDKKILSSSTMQMFKEFAVKDVLNVEQTKSVVAKADLTEGDIPYVTRTVSDNGYMGTCGNKEKINKGSCITIGAETGVAFYQPNDFVAGNKVYRLSREGLNIKEYLFLASVLNVQTKNYSYSNARIPEKIKAERILLPVIKSSDPDHEYTATDIDWQYMERYIRVIEKLTIADMVIHKDRTIAAAKQVIDI